MKKLTKTPNPPSLPFVKGEENRKVLLEDENESQEILDLPEEEAKIITKTAMISKRSKIYRAWNERSLKLKRLVGSGRGASLERAIIVRNVALGVLAMVVAGTLSAGLLFAWYARDLPRPDRIVRREGFSTKLLDRSGELLYEVFSEQQRTPITLEQAPDHLKKATIAIEDKNFYEHGGFDPQGIIRAIYTNIFRGRRVGGSTLTQQLVKNVLLTSEKKLSRKIKEFILAVQIESQYNKDEILQMYLNEAPYGGTAWGVATAAQTYFGKEVSELNLTEAAILAGMPQAPSYYTPFGSHPEAYIGRTQDVLRRMREDGYIDAELEASVAASLAEVEFNQGYTSIKAPHFSLYVKQLLEEMYDQNLVEKGGLKVTTTLDYELHQKAQEIVTEEISQVVDMGIGNGAALVMEPKTGEILAMVGSKDFFATDYDGQVNVTLSKRQPGSSIKPVTYATAFAKGYSPAHVLMDVPTKFPSGDGSWYEPANYDGSFRGPVQLRFALGSSLNIPAVKLLALVGIEDMLKTAYEMGFSTLEPTSENMKRFGLAVTLGGGEVRLIDMVSAYSAFANGGLKTEPVAILKVEDRDGKVLYEHKPVEGKRVLEEGVAFLVNHVLTDNNARTPTFGSNSYLNMGGRPVAVKTGTTNDKRDNWTVGWSNSGMVGVWVGNNDNTPMKRVASGVTGSSPIWRQIMVEVLEKYPAEQWHIPGNVEAVMVDSVSGYPEHDGYPARSEYVIKGTLPALPDPVHAKLKLCRGQDKLATDLDIERGDYDEKEFFVFTEDVVIGDAPSWQEGINAWANGNEDSRYRPPKDYCDTANEVMVSLEEPKDESEFEGEEIQVRIRVVTQGEVDRVEVMVDGVKKETLTARPYETKLTLKPGRYVIKAKAIRKDGKTGESGEARIGVGGEPWEEAEPTATPTPTKKAVPKTPTATPTGAPEEEEE